MRIQSQLSWLADEDTHMSVDSTEDEWLALHDVRLIGAREDLEDGGSSRSGPAHGICPGRAKDQGLVAVVRGVRARERVRWA